MTGPPLPAVTGAILAGGDSRRMGRDKALLAFDGRPLLEIVHERVAPFCSAMLVVTRPERCAALAETAPPGCRVVGDILPGRGPLVGIHAALAASATDRVLVVAVDMPWLQPGLLAAMIAQATGDVTIPRTVAGWEPTHALYHRRCRPVIAKRLAAGSAPVAGILGELEIDVWDEPRWRKYDPEGRSFANLNTPADLT